MSEHEYLRIKMTMDQKSLESHVDGGKDSFKELAENLFDKVIMELKEKNCKDGEFQVIIEWRQRHIDPDKPVELESGTREWN